MSGGTFNKFSPADGDGLVSWLSDSRIGTAVWLALRANSYVKLFPESVTNIAPFELHWQTRNDVAAKFPVGLSSKSNNAVELIKAFLKVSTLGNFPTALYGLLL